MHLESLVVHFKDLEGRVKEQEIRRIGIIQTTAFARSARILRKVLDTLENLLSRRLPCKRPVNTDLFFVCLGFMTYQIFRLLNVKFI